VADRPLRDTVVALVGAAGGLGAPIARTLDERGAHVVLAGPHPDRLQAAAPRPDSLVVEIDIRDHRAGDALISAVTRRFGRLDGLVNAAGVVAFGDLVDTDDDVVEEIFLTNVLGPLWLIKRATPLLAESKGFVLNVSAVVAEQPLPGMAAYSASKAALSAADRALARELRRQGISVLDARPPHTETGLATRALSGRAPRLPERLDPTGVAKRLVEAIEAGEVDLPSERFVAPS